MSTDTTTAVAPERPAPPSGHVYLQDVLDVVRDYDDGWCYEAERVVARLFRFSANIDLQEWDDVDYCCESCAGGLSRQEWQGLDSKGARRFTLVDQRRTVTVGRLKDAIRAQYGDGGDSNVDELCRRLVALFNLPVTLG